ncbi:Uncharacterized conserved protein YbbK, DUF523 family [Streptoalloteichus tenebrarius]|uniref:Uncharacterized conserved protein YbbK, DUF523 family n=1 Tax=Streptoalloteichus tenebrarius (strain ATCC 17920 / DSM 40477 / JCM 4838 / CBS 697.72 / NBRC 16177 / NCIMB 11028 / NRRL B-12390 / A12253. 1 / ISP 5477) TaxID=1933 RepID=A0ABT1I0R4_STRSD|nr:DUF523 domain-containing protein [Streptoalloteichus tenebrarius]MCP2261381.1 Uncharacterized conserved protein YbbK, DUF523 family [Streptoalloteichus tenebrarius]BFF00923.1 DUF523 domain-containing protein [Streptoalloteichus tenebrarius]
MLLVSACLAGVPCRYDGRAKTVEELRDAVGRGEAVAVCPEMAGGLRTPRRPAEIVGGTGDDVLAGRARVLDDAGEDLTEEFVAGAHHALEVARRHGVDRAVLHDRSPSCGSQAIYDGAFHGRTVPGAGVTAALLLAHGIEVQPPETTG